ncbi:MAG: hypothetical protein N2578_03595 [Bdellovibrionaceae bacterium]|nr:hypothetical protein [Pseudobdellovibrionaceae bacterium]
MRSARALAFISAIFLLGVHSKEAAGVDLVEASSPLRRATAVLLFGGVGGGILGLSTLSFYGNPQEHTQNITTGAVLGTVGAAAWLLYDAGDAANPPVTIRLDPLRNSVIVGRVWGF